jgi:hypothetical protein
MTPASAARNAGRGGRVAVPLGRSALRVQAIGLPPLSGPASMREFGAVSCPAVQAGA